MFVGGKNEKKCENRSKKRLHNELRSVFKILIASFE